MIFTNTLLIQSILKLQLLFFLIVFPSITHAQNELTPNEVNQIITSYASRNYEILNSLMKYKGYKKEKERDDFELDDVKYSGFFSFNNSSKKHFIIEDSITKELSTKEYPFGGNFEFESSIIENKVVVSKIKAVIFSSNYSSEYISAFKNKFIEEINGSIIKDFDHHFTFKMPDNYWVTRINEDANKIIPISGSVSNLKLNIDSKYENWYSNVIELQLVYVLNENTLNNRVTQIPLKEKLGVFNIDAKINNMDFELILDSGASYLTLDAKIGSKLWESGFIKKEHILKEINLKLADGSIKEGLLTNLPYIEINNKKYHNIHTVFLENCEPLLGKSFLDKFSNWKINNDNLTLELTP